MIYLPDKSLFVHIPRTGESSVVLSYMRAANNIHYDMPVINMDARLSNKVWRHSTVAQLYCENDFKILDSI